MGTGFVVGRLMKMYPIDTAIVNACHSGQGGAGDVAILTAAFTVVNVVTIAATVVTLMGTGFVVGRLMKMNPIDTAIVNACHSGQGGTGDVAILTAANRMQLMPFAQIATRIGGAIVVTVTLILLAHFGA